MAYEELGAYREPPLTRKLIERKYGDLNLSLTSSQHGVLSRVLEIAEEQRDSTSLIPVYVSAETGAGKSYLSLIAAAAVAKQLSLGLSKLHSVYLSPTKFLASQMRERANHLYESMKSALGEIELIELKGDMPSDKKSEEVERALTRLKGGARLVLTNPQMLASLAVRRSTSYRIADRVVPFNLISGLAEVDLYIVDEPHFYMGKSFIRLLTLLLEIGRWKLASSIPGPTFLLFISATMHPLSIDGALKSLESVLGIDVLDKSIPLEERDLRLEDRESGEKLISLGVSDFQGLVELVDRLDSPKVVYADSINLLISLQENIRGDSVILHSQMPSYLWDSYLNELEDVETVLMTSVGEVGIELERLNFAPSTMVSVNSIKVMKVVQRLGRLARRAYSKGEFYNVDLPWARRKVSELFANGQSVKDENLPSFLERAEEYKADFFSSYVSPCADRDFHSRMKDIEEGKLRLEVPKIYLTPSVELKSVDEEEILSLPLMKVASTVIPVSKEHELKVWRSDLSEELVYEVRKRSGSQPLHMIKLRTGRGKFDVVIRNNQLPEWLRNLGVVEVTVKWKERLEIELPLLKYKFRAQSPVMYFIFGSKRFGRGFRWSDEYSYLETNLEPPSHDMDFIVPEGFSDTVIAYEPFSEGDFGIGAVEEALRIIAGERLNLKCV